jgi:diguanylate cyclase (GGDEF)-like protein
MANIQGSNGQFNHSPVALERILLIEDDPDVSVLIRQLLVEDGYQVTVAGTAEEGEALFDPLAVDLIIVDAMLPGMSGWDFCHLLKERHPRPYVPILMLTARAALIDRVRGLEAGADDYLTKPFDIDELLAHVRAMLRIRRVELRLWRHARELEALNAVATIVNSSLDLTPVLSQTIERVAGTAGARVGAIWLADPEDGTLALTANTGLASQQVDALRRVRRMRALAQRASRAGEPLVTAAGADDLLGRAVADLESAIYLPLTSKETPIGLMALGSDRADAFSPEMARLLSTLSITIAVAADNARLYAQTRRIADTDPLTSLFNHRYMQDAVEAEIRRSSRSHRPFALMMIDLNNFKAVNDTLGHPAGDQLLRHGARLLIAACRKTDSVGRYGGDEFIILLPETNAEQASALAERIQAAAAELSSAMPPGAPEVSLSIGIAVYPYDSAVRQELIKAADRAMYEAKYDAKGLGGSRSRIASGAVAIGRRTGEGPLAHLESLVTAADSRTGFSRNHAEYSARYASLLARALGLPEETERAVRIAALLHDVGNIGIPRELLTREGPLTPDEREIIKQHVILSEMLIEQVPHLDAVLEAVMHHHERWDGTGYPRGLSGEAIPPLGRLLAVATAYAAMQSPRPYRPALVQADAIRELRAGANTQFDPTMVEAFIAGLEQQAAIT